MRPWRMATRGTSAIAANPIVPVSRGPPLLASRAARESRMTPLPRRRWSVRARGRRAAPSRPMLCARDARRGHRDTSRETASQSRGVDPTEFGARARRGAETDTGNREDRQRGRLREAVLQEFGQFRRRVRVAERCLARGPEPLHEDLGGGALVRRCAIELQQPHTRTERLRRLLHVRRPPRPGPSFLVPAEAHGFHLFGLLGRDVRGAEVAYRGVGVARRGTTSAVAVQSTHAAMRRMLTSSATESRRAMDAVVQLGAPYSAPLCLKSVENRLSHVKVSRGRRCTEHNKGRTRASVL